MRALARFNAVTTTPMWIVSGFLYGFGLSGGSVQMFGAIVWIVCLLIAIWCRSEVES